jgi:hypothetical protein
MSLDEILDRCDISVRVLVRSTKESRPSSAESKRTDRCCDSGASLVGVLEDDSIDGM